MKTKYQNWIVFPIFLIISFVLFSFITQNNDSKNVFSPSKGDTTKLNQPKVDVKVNKKYDEQGNLIQYDSSYSIIYSSPGSEIYLNNMSNDSIFAQLREKFNSHSFFNEDPFFGVPKFNFNDDFFNFDPMDNFKQMNEMMKKMFPNFKNDSLLIAPPTPQQPSQKSSEPVYKPDNMITL